MTSLPLPTAAFLAIWNASATSRDAAKALGLPTYLVSRRARKLRSRGYDVKRMDIVSENPESEAIAREPRAPVGEPTTERPGTDGKLAVICQRARSGQELWHKMDTR